MVRFKIELEQLYKVDVNDIFEDTGMIVLAKEELFLMIGW